MSVVHASTPRNENLPSIDRLPMSVVGKMTAAPMSVQTAVLSAMSYEASKSFSVFPARQIYMVQAAMISQ